jgi:hypothetical protein
MGRDAQQTCTLRRGEDFTVHSRHSNDNTKQGKNQAAKGQVDFISQQLNKTRMVCMSQLPPSSLSSDALGHLFGDDAGLFSLAYLA